jgi:hypothetical protein
LNATPEQVTLAEAMKPVSGSFAALGGCDLMTDIGPLAKKAPIMSIRSQLGLQLATAAILLGSLVTGASAGGITLTVDPNAPWQGFMNVFEIDRSEAVPTRGGFVFGSGWGFNDLTASFNDIGTLTLGVNTIGDPNEFWYQNTSGTAQDPQNPGGPGQLGNKWMDANGFVQFTNDASLTGTSLTFTGIVQSNSFTANHTATAFIRDFAPDFSSFEEATVALTPGVFSVSLDTVEGEGRHIQIGFNVGGENVWITDAPAFGNVQVAAIPEPSSLALLATASLGWFYRRRLLPQRRKLAA